MPSQPRPVEPFNHFVLLVLAGEGANALLQRKTRPDNEAKGGIGTIDARPTGSLARPNNMLTFGRAKGLFADIR